jgi:hypothetical protein
VVGGQNLGKFVLLRLHAAYEYAGKSRVPRNLNGLRESLLWGKVKEPLCKSTKS